MPFQRHARSRKLIRRFQSAQTAPVVMRRGGPRAFTLVELLVVISVIALLLALLLPALENAREEGNSIVCQTQMDQLFRGIFFYVDEFEGRLPFMSVNGVYQLTAGLDIWIAQVANQLGNPRPRLFRCPSDAAPAQNHTVRIKNGTWITGGGRRLDVSYRGSCDLIEIDWRQGRRITTWQRPTDAILLLEGPPGAGPDGCFRFTWLTEVDMRYERAHWARHNGTTNYLFMDGHQERLPIDQAADVILKQEIRTFSQ